MKNFKSVLSIIALTALMVSCDPNTDNPTPNPNPNPSGKEFKGVIFATGITNPEGNNGSVYMQALSDLLRLLLLNQATYMLSLIIWVIQRLRLLVIKLTLTAHGLSKACYLSQPVLRPAMW